MKDIKARAIKVDKSNRDEPDKRIRLFDKNNKLSPKPKIKYVKQGPAPDRRNFALVARSCPAIKDLVQSLSWDCKNKKLEVTFTENSAMEAYRWFSVLSEKRKEVYDNSPFPDLEHESIALSFMDKDRNELAKFKLSGIDLTAHKCFVSSVIQEEEKLLHHVTLSYDKAEPIEAQQSNWDTLINEDEIADEEWSEVELVLTEEGENELESELPK